jgi:hypothetical protein
MEHFKSIRKQYGVDVGYHSSNIHPSNGEGCVGARGIDKNYSLVQVIELAYKMEEKPNIIIKAGKNAKWYFKKINLDEIEEKINQQRWRNTKNYTMYVIEWEM